MSGFWGLFGSGAQKQSYILPGWYFSLDNKIRMLFSASAGASSTLSWHTVRAHLPSCQNIWWSLCLFFPLMLPFSLTLFSKFNLYHVTQIPAILQIKPSLSALIILNLSQVLSSLSSDVEISFSVFILLISVLSYRCKQATGFMVIFMCCCALTLMDRQLCSHF